MFSRTSAFFILQCILTVHCSSLMKRIREKQTADGATNKGLDFLTQDWINIPQPVQDVLMSIDDKLRNLDTLSYTLKLARLDFSLDQLVKRMDSIETKVGRLETKFDVRMEKIEEIVISKDIKEEFSNEHLSRRIENLNEKINNKASYLDAKLDVKLERILGKLEHYERDLQNGVDDVLERLVRNEERFETFSNDLLKREIKHEELAHSVDEIHSYIKEDFTKLLQCTSQNLSSHILGLRTTVETSSSKTLDKLETLDSKLDHGTRGSNSTTAVSNLAKNLRFTHCDESSWSNLTSNFQSSFHDSEEKLKKLDSDLQIYAKKIVNGIQELWQISDKLKMDISDSITYGNRTRDRINREFRLLQQQLELFPKLENKVKQVGDNVILKLSALSSTVDNHFATLLVSQNSFISSCHRIQDDETHVYEILQQIVYEMRNRSVEDNRKIQLEFLQYDQRLNGTLTQILESSNSTANVVQDMFKYCHRRDECMLRTNVVTCKLVDSLCNSKPLVTSSERLVKLISNPDGEEFADDRVHEEPTLPRNFSPSGDRKNYDFIDYPGDTEHDYND